MSDDRIMLNILARSEARVLGYISRRLPSWVTPDGLTWLGFFGSILTFSAYLATWISPAFFALASFGILVNWFGDSLDGNLARLRRTERPIFGFFFDQTIDLLSALLIALGLGLSIGARADLCLFALTGYFAIGASTLIEFAISKRFFVATSWMGLTELRLLIVMFNAALQFVPYSMAYPLLGIWSVSDILVATLGVGFWIYYIMQFIRNFRSMPRN